MNNLRLKAKIIENGMSIDEFAQKINMCGVTLRKKLKGESDFTVGETKVIQELLHLSNEQVIEIFY